MSTCSNLACVSPSLCHFVYPVVITLHWIPCYLCSGRQLCFDWQDFFFFGNIWFAFTICLIERWFGYISISRLTWLAANAFGGGWFHFCQWKIALLILWSLHTFWTYGSIWFLIIFRKIERTFEQNTFLFLGRGKDADRDPLWKLLFLQRWNSLMETLLGKINSASSFSFLLRSLNLIVIKWDSTTCWSWALLGKKGWRNEWTYFCLHIHLICRTFRLEVEHTLWI